MVDHGVGSTDTVAPPVHENSQQYEQIIAQILVKNKDYDYFCKTIMMMMKKYVVKIVVLVAAE